MEEVVCVVCAQFEPQTWRKSMCKNCFHTNEEHTGNVDSTTSHSSEGLQQKQVTSSGDTTPTTGNDKLSSLKTNNGSKTSPVSPPKSNSKSATKSVTAVLTSKFGTTVSKNKENGKNDSGKSGSKSVSTAVKSSTEPAKRLTTSKQQTPDPKAPVKITGLDKKQNGIDIKSKVIGVKDNITKVGQKFGEIKTSEAKPRLGTEAGCPVSRPDVSKPASSSAASSRYIGASIGGSPNKLKHLSKSFGTVEESDDACEEKKASSDLDKHAIRTNSDVTGKCQTGEGSHVTAKTLVIGKEKESVASSVLKTGPGGAGSGRTVKLPSSRSFDDGSSKSPSITISLRGGAAEVKIGKTDQKSKVTQRLEDDKEKSREKEFLELKAKEKELLELKAKEKDLLAKEKEYNELKAREKDLRDLRSKERELKSKEKEYQVLLAKEKELEKLKFKEREIQDKENEIKNLKLKEQELRNLKAKENEIKAKEVEIQKQEDVLKTLKSKLSEMEKKCKDLEEENTTLKRKSLHDTKGDAEQILEDLRRQLSSMEGRCFKLEEDNTNLKKGLKEKEEAVMKNSHGSSQEMLDLGHKFRESEKDVCEVEDENTKLKREIRELRDEMDEMYDTFRENEVDEFRDLQKELEITGKNCRILQFKLRKAERRNEQVEKDKDMYEERLRILQSQFETEDTRAHIRKVEEELQMAKEVSVRLHDELDLLEDKKSKAEEDSRHLTELLEQADKKQFRMEMEIDKLRDQIMDLKQELKYASKQDSSDRKSLRQ